MNRQHRPGTYSGYTWHIERRKELAKDGKPYGKRHKICPPCTNANAVQQVAYRKRVYLNGGKGLYMPGCGVRRRLQALATRGWTMKEIARRYGHDSSSLSNMMCRRNKKYSYGDVHDKIAALYDELWMVPPPDDYTIKRQANLAARMGYLPPLCWDDDTIDDPYALPSGMSNREAFNWFWHAASDIEKVQWVLKHGLGITRATWYTHH